MADDKDQFVDGSSGSAAKIQPSSIMNNHQNTTKSHDLEKSGIEAHDTITTSLSNDFEPGRGQEPSTVAKIHNLLSYIPPRCRYKPTTDGSPPFKFSWALTVLFAAAGCFTVANLYYSHPILNLLAHDFAVSNEQASLIPTCAQAGYFTGLFLLNPPGDLVRRRPYILTLIFVTATLWIGLCLTASYQTFLALSFLTGMTTVTPQLMLPLVGELAPAHRRATALSIVVAGLLLGLLVARLLSGVVTLYIGWRYIYWISFGLQSIIFALLWLFMPDYPSTNPEPTWAKTAKAYPSILFDCIKLPFRYPVLLQSCIIGLLTAAPFTSFWTTLTFLLSSPPYSYNSLHVGLFALVGILAMGFVPLIARVYTEHHSPLHTVLLATMFNLVGCILGTFLSPHHVAGPIIQAATTELFMQLGQVGNRMSMYYGTEGSQRNRVNTSYMLSTFSGQLIGTSVGNAVYARSGWIGSGSLNIGLLGGALFFAIVRGPNEKGWIGWNGGWRSKKKAEEESNEIKRGDSEVQNEEERHEDVEISEFKENKTER